MRKARVPVATQHRLARLVPNNCAGSALAAFALETGLAREVRIPVVVPAGVQGPGDRGIPGKAIAQFSSRRAQITKGTLALAHEYDGRGHAAEPGRNLLPAGEQASAVVRIHNGRDYRFSLVTLPAGDGVASTQAIFGDVTEKRRQRRLATRYAALVVQVEEDQRRPQVQVGIQGQEAADPGAVLMDQSKGPIRYIADLCYLAALGG